MSARISCAYQSAARTDGVAGNGVFAAPSRAIAALGSARTPTPATLAAPRLLALPVFAEEAWPSIQLCADMLVEHLQRGHRADFATSTAPLQFRTRLGHIPGLNRLRTVRNAERLINRFWDYSRQLGQWKQHFDLFHVCDHSYSQLVHELPTERTGVLCQDLDTFRCWLEPQAERRPRWFRRMTKRILDGFQKAAVVFHTTQHVREQIERHQLFDPARLVHAPLGIAPEFAELARREFVAPQPNGRPYLLHVGSCIPRKRIDVLLRIVAGVRTRRPDVALMKIGGEFTSEQRALIEELGLNDVVQHRSGVPRMELAELYRNSIATLVTSEREGFGLPVIEALACGSVVVANDIPPLREGGGVAAIFRSIDDPEAWVDAIEMLVDDGQSAPPLELRRSHALQFTWEAHAAAVANAYLRLLRE